MRRGATFVLVMLLAGPLAATAQPAGAPLEDLPLQGMRLFNQSCRVCHTKPQVASPQYAPALSRASLGGQELALHSFIANGSPRMPGFKHHFKPAEIDAIVAYIKTIAQPAH